MINGQSVREPRRYPVSLILTEREDKALRDLAAEQDLSINATMVQALRLYQLHHHRLKTGETHHWSGDAQRMADFAGDSNA